ncbi:hypothetical protein YLM1_0183 [Methanobrevibacter olleyae]|uniref:Uncharacterized protein n=1 Tax=Methanobrevibacter olleyae TaxID=294671 RepID=A0A126QX50_METOL|nr:hypothetical protein YLM1_0183 [Methanobrevibacter olleyae]
MITIWKIEINISTGLNEIVLPINSKVIIGVKIGEIKVDTAVKETDNARSPLARKVIRSDAVPPGTVPTRIKPTVKPKSNEKKVASAKDIRGIIKYCIETPIKISLGLLKTFRKLSNFNVVPIAKIIRPKSIFIRFTPINSSKTQLNELG